MAPVFRILSEALPGGAVRFYAESDINQEDLYARLPFQLNEMEKLANSTVAIFGAGAGGALLALRMAQAGVGKLRLIDPATVQPYHLIRHLCSIDDVGKYKVAATAEIVLKHNPTVQVEAYPSDAFFSNAEIGVEYILSGVDLVIAATDQVGIQLAINAATWKAGVPTVFGGCYEGAKGGEVFFTLPKEGTPCLACLRSGLRPPEVGPFDYSAASSLEDFHGEPGLSAAVDTVTNIEAQVALGLLLRDTSSALGELIHPELNFLLVGNALSAGFYRFKRPFHVFWQPLSGPRPDCPICQQYE